MLHDLNQQLTDIKNRLQVKRHLEKRYWSTQEMLEQEKARSYQLLAQLQKEQADVQALEGMSLTAFFYSVFGDKAMQMHKEKKEFAAAKLKHDECNESVIALTQEVSELSSQLEQYQTLDDDYNAVLQAKENALRYVESGDVKLLDQFTEEQSELQAGIVEYQEAIAAGNEACHAIEDTLEKLQSAKNWGVGDMVMGGLVVTMIKHSKIDEARSRANHAQHLLKRFERELKDIEYHPQQIQIEIGSLLTFADYFFDGLLIDWMAQSRINASFEKVNKIKNELKTLLNDLKEGLSSLESKKYDIEERKVLFLESV